MQTCGSCKFKTFGVCSALALGTPNSALQPKYKTAKARSVLVRPKSSSEGLQILCSGYAIKYLNMEDRKRQILSLRRPSLPISGGACQEQNTSFSTVALTDVQVAYIENSAIRAAVAADTSVFGRIVTLMDAEALEISQLVVDLGRRNALGRVAHLMCKILEWTHATVTNNQAALRIPLRQDDIADFMGLTQTHVNRTLAELRRRNIIKVVRDIVMIDDVDALKQLIE